MRWTSGFGVLLAFMLCSVNAPEAGGKAPARFARVTVKVVGDVNAALVDSHGRRTGWYGGRVEDIPECTLEAIDDEVALPPDYAFHFTESGNRAYLLLATPRTEGEVEISVEALRPNGRRCVARTAAQLTDGEHRWRVGWKAHGDSCDVTITPVLQRKTGSHS